MEIRITERRARRSMLMKHGLPGLYRFRGGSGALEFLRQAGCIQLVPVDVCGKNAELILQSRVKGLQSRRLTSLCTRQRAISVVVRPFDALFIVLPPELSPYRSWSNLPFNGWL